MFTVSAEPWFWAMSVIVPTALLFTPLAWLVWKVRKIEMRLAPKAPPPANVN